MSGVFYVINGKSKSVHLHVEMGQIPPCKSQEVMKRKPSAYGYNWVTLFLGDINTGSHPSRMRESQVSD
jgi:hypothetical protein